MSDNDSESSCLSALEDPTLGGTRPVERNSNTPESEELIFLETKSNLSDDDQSEQPTSSKSTTASYQDCTSLDDVSSTETSRNSTPVNWLSLVDPNDEFFAKKVLTEKDDVESLKLEEIKEESFDQDLLPEQESADDESPNRNQQEDESSTELPEEDETVVEIQQDVVESPKSEERIAEQRSADESPTKKQEKDEPIDKETLEKYTGDVESPAKVQQEDDSVVAKHQDVVESTKSEKIKEELIVTDRLTEQEDESSIELQEEDEVSTKSEERTAEQSSADESPTKKQEKDEPIGKETLEKYRGDVESPAEVQQEDDSVVAKHQDVVESTKFEKIKEELIVTDRLTEQEDESSTELQEEDEVSPKSEERTAEQSSADESPTKKQKKDEPIDKETLEKYTGDVESPTKVQQADDSVMAKHQGVVKSPKSEEVKEESIVKNRLTEQESADESPNKKQQEDESSTELQEEDETVVAKQQDVVESSKSEERTAEQSSADESPTKKQEKDEPIDKETLEKYTGNVESPTKVQQADDSVMANHQDVVESPKSEKIKEESIVKDRLTEQEIADESPNKNQQEDESSTELQEGDETVVAKQQDEVELPISQERMPEQESGDESPTKKQMLEKYTGDVESSANVQQEDDPVVAIHQDVKSPKSEEQFEEQISADKSPIKKSIDKETSEESTVDVEKSGITDESIVKTVLAKHENDVESPTKVHQKDDPKDQPVVESPQREETIQKRLAENGNDGESPTKKPKGEAIDKKTLEECKGNVESPKKDKIEDESTVKEELAEPESVVESPENKEIPDEPIDEETGDEQKNVVVLPKPEEEIKNELIESELPGKEQNKDESVVAHDSDNLVKVKADVLADETKSPKHGSDKPGLSGKNPSRPSLDKEYFEYILKGFYKTNNIRIDECKGGDASSIQPSFMCEVKKFTLIGCKDNTRKFRLDVIVKQLHSKDHQELYKSDIAAKNEEIAYNTIFPNLNMNGISLPVPICFFANDEQIVIQDFCGIKYKAFEKKTGFMTIKECGYTLKALAKFHAATFVLKYKNNEKFQKIKNLTKNNLYNNDAIKSPLLEHQEASLHGILSVLTSTKQSEKDETKIKALEYLIQVAKNDIKDLVCKEQDDNVFCHGDLLLTNILFKLNDGKQKKMETSAEMDIKLIDFQNVQYCSVASDLVYLLFVNLKPEHYIDKKDDLLLIYFNSLKRNVIDCGVGDNFTLTYEWLEKEMDRFTEYGIIYALWILPMFDRRGDDNEDPSKEVTKDMLTSKEIFYNDRMRRWVDYYSTIYEKKFAK